MKAEILLGKGIEESKKNREEQVNRRSHGVKSLQQKDHSRKLYLLIVLRHLPTDVC